MTFVFVYNNNDILLTYQALDFSENVRLLLMFVDGIIELNYSNLSTVWCNNKIICSYSSLDNCESGHV